MSLNRSVYLAGPIDNCTHEEMWVWRDRAEALLHPMHCFSPCKRTFTDNNPVSFRSKEVVTLDKAEIAASDCLLVYYNEPLAGSRMTGTTMEIIYAFERGKLVVVVTDIERVSSWVDYHSHRIFKTLEEGTTFIKDFYAK
ncbi:MAG: nucleoside 2-deoxyribosyltransferase [Candidatus Bathyarchaeia archaeon]